MNIEQTARDPEWMSDYVVDLLRDMGLEFVALNPGASYRGLHDSLVNHGSGSPEILTCLHEEHAVAIAHGYARVTGKPMAVALHANVGLMHASMAIYNAWCDRVPMVILGATGPVDSARRRPWIDWIHTSADQAALVRPFLKWDDQPASIEAAAEALVRANALTRTYPSAPVYVCLDSAMQEAAVVGPLPNIDVRRYRARPATTPGPGTADAARTLLAARNPVIMIGRVNRSEQEWDDRVLLAERIGARVVTDLNCGASFPTEHPLHVSSSQMLRGAGAADAVRDADVILALDWVDLGGTLRAACGGEPGATTVVCSLDDVLWNGWSKDHGGFAPTDIALPAAPGDAVRALLDEIPVRETPRIAPANSDPVNDPAPTDAPGPLTLMDIAQALRETAPTDGVSYVRFPLNWQGGWVPFHHPLDFIGYDGGAAIGSGPGMAIGSALALREIERIPVAVLGDGDTSMGISALWSAARYGIPLLIVVANNQTYGNDEVHQVQVARMRERPVENAWVGQRMTEPAIDYSALARAQGFDTHPVVHERAQLRDTLRIAMEQVAEGACVLVEVRIS